jgi:hypothetical protein
VSDNKRRKALQEAKNERYKAERDYAFAEPKSGEEKMAKFRFMAADRLVKRIKAKADKAAGAKRRDNKVR